jgi:hypothetical protein
VRTAHRSPALDRRSQAGHPQAGVAPTSRALTSSVRVVGAALLVATGWIHLHLWQDGYRDIDWIGPLFLASVVLTGLAALAVLAAPARVLPWIALLAGLLEIGTLGGLVLSLTVGLFGFFESSSAPLVLPTVLVEAAGFLVLAGYGIGELWRSRRRAPRASSWVG